MANEKNEYYPQTVTHPGEDLREKLEEIQMSPKEFAVRCNKPVKTISEVLNKKSAITPEMAIQFENVLKIPAGYWLKRQYHYDESLARQSQKAAIGNALEWARLFPYAEMAKKKWVTPTRKVEEKAKNLMIFFGFSSHISWEKFYIKSELKASFRVSLAHASSPYCLSAWLRKGDLQAQSLDAPAYSVQQLKQILPSLKEIMAEQPKDFFKLAQSLCLEAGLKLVYTPCLPKAPINGVARWVDNNRTPLIQLSSRHKQNDIFWFSFFHELGHILLHGRKEIFLENIKYEGLDKDKEEEADAFAIQWTFSEKEEKEMMSHGFLDSTQVISYAKKIGTHPGIIIGRLQKKGVIPYSVGNSLIERINLDVLVDQ